MIIAQPKRAEYVFTDDDIKIRIEVDFISKSFTIFTKESQLDFCFLDCDIDRAKRVISLMLAATEYARQAINGNRGWENVTDHIKSTIRTDIEIDALYPKQVSLSDDPTSVETHDGTDGKNKDDSNTPHGNS